MDPMLVVSPHLDDAVLSVGQLLAGREDAVVATVFAGAPMEHVSTSYDRNCGWANAADAATGRRAEDDLATHLLRATPVRMEFLDAQYRELGLTNLVDTTEEEITGTVRYLARRMVETMQTPLTMVGPMGLVHPDHHIVRRAVESAAQDLPGLIDLWLYEDLPARVLWPESVPDALAWWAGMGWHAELAFLGTGDLVIKEAAVRAYGSQLWAPEFGGDPLHHVLVPERLWRLTRG